MPLSPPTRLSPELSAALRRGAHVVTATVRAARAVRRAFAEDARTQGLSSWQAPAVTDWSSWVIHLYGELSGMPILLSPIEEETLWKRVEAEDAAQVVSPPALARLSQSAYDLLSTYNAHSSRGESWAAAHEDSERFLVWADAFDALCDKLNVLPCSEIEASLSQNLHATLPEELLLLGFDRLTPAQTSLLRAFEGAGITITQPSLPPAAAQQQLFTAADEAEELRACALWLRGELARNPDIRIGVLVPELQGVKPAIDRAFRRILQPDVTETAPPYEFSLGSPLGAVPLVAAALLLLRWLAGPLAAAEVTSLLTGGFLAIDAREALALAQLDVELRRAGMLTSELSLARLLRHAEASPSLFPPQFVLRLRAAALWQQRFAGATRRRLHAEWAEAAMEQLEGYGWPGFRELGSVAYQARERWDVLLRSVAALGVITEPIPWQTFTAELQGFALHTLFAAESRNAPVQVLGAIEASGLAFDAIWFLQLTESKWPGSGRLHPLLALAVQRDAGMPHASGKADLALSAEQLRRILASAPRVVLSYAKQVDGTESRISPQLRNLALTPLSFDTTVQSIPCAVLRDTEPAHGTPWPATQPVGSDALKLQSACGFRSFATRRLMSGELEDESWGLDASERGVLLHSALQELWSTQSVVPDADRLHTRDDLRTAIGDGSIDERLQNAIERAFSKEMRRSSGDSWRTRFLVLEQQRLFLRLRLWLDVEQERAQFKVVALEQQIDDAHIGDLQLRLRVDRIDEVEHGDHLLLDYKTAGDVSPKLWHGDRPDEPQLPVYALFGGVPRVAGVAFAQVRVGGKTKLHALADNPPTQIGSAIKAATLEPGTRDEWDRVLHRLAGEFLRGEAPINPKRGELTCNYCSLHAVCRVRAQGDSRLLAEDDLADDKEEESTRA